MNETTTTPDVYTLVTNRIIAQLEQGTVPWKKPWVDAGLPKNLISRIPYRGINVWMLASLDYAENLFITWKQAKEIGASVKKGEKGHLVVFWKVQENEEPEQTDKPKKKSILRYYWVFNIAQCDGISENLLSPIDLPEPPIAAYEDIIEGVPDKPVIKHIKAQAFYDVEQDCINMPKMKTFINAESYYATLYHELIHFTGHEKRLNRKEITEMVPFGSESYSIEELTAEIGACYLSSHVGIKVPFENNVAYINGWLEKLKNDKRFIIYASSHAQRAIDYILGNQFVNDAK